MIADEKNSDRLLDRAAAGVLQRIDHHVRQANVQLGAKFVIVRRGLVHAQKMPSRVLRYAMMPLHLPWASRSVMALKKADFSTPKPRGKCDSKPIMNGNPLTGMRLKA